jgi:hypothetical protein
MSQVVVCATGFSPSEKHGIESMVHELGGRFIDDLTTIATVLIAKHQGTLKSRTSTDVLKIPVVSEKWLYDSFKKKTFTKFYERYKLPVLGGLKIWTYKIDTNRKSKIRKLGGILATHQSQECFCILTDPEYQKMLQLCVPGMKVVTSLWLDRIIEEGKWIEPEDYAVQTTEPTTQELYLARCVFFIDDLAEEEGKVIREIIILGGGTYVNSQHPCITHVISAEGRKAIPNTIKLTPNSFMQACLNKSFTR